MRRSTLCFLRFSFCFIRIRNCRRCSLRLGHRYLLLASLCFELFPTLRLLRCLRSRADSLLLLSLRASLCFELFSLLLCHLRLSRLLLRLSLLLLNKGLRRLTLLFLSLLTHLLLLNLLLANLLLLDRLLLALNSSLLLHLLLLL